MAELRLNYFQVQALWEIVINNDPDIVLLPPDGILCFTHRLVVQLVKDCLKKQRQYKLTSEYLTDLCHNIKTLVHQAEKRSQYGDLAFMKQLAEKVLCVLEDPARSSERPDLIRSLIPAGEPRMSDYETSKLISCGAFGSVHLVRHKDSQEIFAMKKMAKRNLNTPQNVKWAYLERDILTFADCPFVASMLCSFPTRSHLCMVMEYVGGGDCRTLLTTRGPLSVPLARMYFAEAVLGVEYLHSYGVVHRDLKPDNLLITSAGHIKITDFGLSKIGVMIPNTNIYKHSAEDIAREFLDCETCGTPCYKAPEVIRQKGYGRPVDWWSMGIILYEFLMGYPPFNGASRSEFYKNVLTGDIKWNHRYTPLRVLQNLITQLLRRSPVQRLGTGDIVWECDRTPPLDAQDLITQLLRRNPVQRLGTGGAFEIKDHPFLRDLDFNNLLSQKPLYVPQLASDVDTSLFITHSSMKKHLVSEDEKCTSEEDKFQNFTSSSERLSKLCTTTNKTMKDEDPKSPRECAPKSSTNISETQKESVSVSERDDVITILPSLSPLSEFPAQTDSKYSPINLIKEEKSENGENGKKRQGSIFRQMLSSCQRGLSRAAEVFACCYCCPRTI
ncbi:microtubule-associated serine/threonine-protein kinase 4-like [Ranitomeya variabilis]|uniref:microtubule-associated serine/threonine-protein kinase 4-like n=1 Tax=Ranitomeya variabilis TaxID=490064 RepID=UPI004056A0F3